MNIQEKAEQYTRELHKSSIDFNGSYDIAKNAYVAGYNEAKRWILVGERLPEIVINGRINYVLCKNSGFPFVGQYTGKKSEFHVIGTEITKHVTEWREI